MRTRAMDSKGWVVIIREDGELPRLAFQGAGGKKPNWPNPERPQQIHLDIYVDDLEATEALVLNLGATRLAPAESDHPIYADPEGHPFCLRAAS
jgi:hypothetical protein